MTATESIVVPRSNEVTQRHVITAPTVVFITERRHGLSQRQLAYAATGRNRETGMLILAVEVRRRQNGLVHFEADLWGLDYNLNPDAIEKLYRYWHDLNADHCLPKRVLRRMECYFGKTTINFDAMAEQVNEWREFLNTVLSDKTTYVAIDSRGAGL